MLKKPHILILILIRIFSVTGSMAQSPMDVKELIRSRFESYCKSTPWEEIYLHTDRQEYLAGEEIWFTVYLIDRQTSGLSSRNSIAYIELLNAENKPVVQKRFRLTSGTAPGHILIPDSLSSGIYTIRGYTNWMKNFLPVNCYMKDINIYNPFNIESFKRKIYQPESENEVITDSKAEQTNSDELTINAVRLSSGDIELSIETRDSIINAPTKEFYLFIQTHGNIDCLTTETITGNRTRISIPGSSLRRGINHLTLFDSAGKPFWEQYMITIPPDRKIRSAIHTRDSLRSRSKLELEFELPEGYKSGNISIAVAPPGMTGEGLDIEEYLIFGSEFGLQPYKNKGFSQSDMTHTTVLDSIKGSLRSYWLTWDKILSDEIAVYKYPHEEDTYHLVGLLLTEDQQIGYPGERIVLSMPGKVAQFQYAITDYKGNFEFSLPIDYTTRDLIIQTIDTVRNYRIFMQSSFSDQYYSADVITDSVPDLIKRSVSDWSMNYQIGKIYGSSYTGEMLSSNPESYPTKRFYGKPDIEIVLKDFVRLSTMEEIFFELIPRVSLKKYGSRYEIEFLNINGENLYDEPPVIMIDGVIYNNTSVIARLDPEIVEKIDVIRGIYYVGNFAFYGIVNVITNAGNFLRFSLPDHSLRLSYRVAEPALSFVSPDYSDNGKVLSRYPDFRNTLYWNPSAKPDTDGRVRISFWSSDIGSDYEITLLSASSEGQFLTSHKLIKVRDF